MIPTCGNHKENRNGKHHQNPNGITPTHNSDSSRRRSRRLFPSANKKENFHSHNGQEEDESDNNNNNNNNNNSANDIDEDHQRDFHENPNGKCYSLNPQISSSSSYSLSSCSPPDSSSFFSLSFCTTDTDNDGSIIPSMNKSRSKNKGKNVHPTNYPHFNKLLFTQNKAKKELFGTRNKQNQNSISPIDIQREEDEEKNHVSEIDYHRDHQHQNQHQREDNNELMENSMGSSRSPSPSSLSSSSSSRIFVPSSIPLPTISKSKSKSKSKNKIKFPSLPLSSEELKIHLPTEEIMQIIMGIQKKEEQEEEKHNKQRKYPNPNTQKEKPFNHLDHHNDDDLHPLHHSIDPHHHFDSPLKVKDFRVISPSIPPSQFECIGSIQKFIAEEIQKSQHETKLTKREEGNGKEKTKENQREIYSSTSAPPSVSTSSSSSFPSFPSFTFPPLLLSSLPLPSQPLFELTTKLLWGKFCRKNEVFPMRKSKGKNRKSENGENEEGEGVCQCKEKEKENDTESQYESDDDGDDSHIFPEEISPNDFDEYIFPTSHHENDSDSDTDAEWFHYLRTHPFALQLVEDKIHSKQKSNSNFNLNSNDKETKKEKEKYADDSGPSPSPSSSSVPLPLSFNCGADCLNRLLQVECNEKNCPLAKEKCQNRMFSQSNTSSPPIIPFKTELKGWGLRATRRLSPGDFLIEYVGEAINAVECKRRIDLENQIISDNLLKIQKAKENFDKSNGLFIQKLKGKLKNKIKKNPNVDAQISIPIVNPKDPSPLFSSYCSNVSSSALSSSILKYPRESNYYFLTISDNVIIDAKKKGAIGRFFNHSCSPNCVIQKWRVVNDEIRIGIFVGENPIDIGEEVTIDYQYDRIGNLELQPCFCGAENCAKFIGGKRKKDEENPLGILRDKEQKKRMKRISESNAKLFAYANADEVCGICGDGGDLMTCDHKMPNGQFCSRVFHPNCVFIDENKIPKKWNCPIHYCDGAYSEKKELEMEGEGEREHANTKNKEKKRKGMKASASVSSSSSSPSPSPSPFPSPSPPRVHMNSIPFSSVFCVGCTRSYCLECFKKRKEVREFMKPFDHNGHSDQCKGGNDKEKEKDKVEKGEHVKSNSMDMDMDVDMEASVSGLCSSPWFHWFDSSRFSSLSHSDKMILSICSDCQQDPMVMKTHERIAFNQWEKEMMETEEEKKRDHEGRNEIDKDNDNEGHLPVEGRRSKRNKIAHH